MKPMKKAVKKKVCTDCGCEKEESGKVWEIGEYELQYYRDHLPRPIQKQFDAIAREQGKAAAFGYTLQIVLRNKMPDLTVHLPDKNVTVMSSAGSMK
jgi:hypothetical protein